MFLLQESSQSFFEQLSEFLQSDVFTSWEFWVVVTAVLLIGEVLTAGFLLGAFVPGSILAALFAAFGWSLQLQLGAFAIGTTIGLALIRPIFLRRFKAMGEPTNVDALIGQTGLVTDAIAPDHSGRVKVQSEEWNAACTEVIAAGAHVRVLRVEGNTLQVEPA